MGEEEKLGIENLLPCLDVIAEIGNVAGEIVAMPDDAKWYEKAAKTLKVSDELFALAKVSWGKVLPEGGDIDESEWTIINEHFDSKFDIPNDKVEALVEKGLRVIRKNVEAIHADIDFAKEIIAAKRASKE